MHVGQCADGVEEELQGKEVVSWSVGMGMATPHSATKQSLSSPSVMSDQETA